MFWANLNGRQFFGGKIGRATKKRARATHISGPPFSHIAVTRLYLSRRGASLTKP